jgi:hypothetical protein
MYTCGGTRADVGFILSAEISSDGDFQEVFSLSDYSIYSLGVSPNGTLWSGGEFLKIHTSSNGVQWSALELGAQVPFHEQDRPAIRKFEIISDQEILFVGGENLNEGIIYHSSNSGVSWTFRFDQHEFRDLCSLDGSSFFVAGHGILSGFDSSLDYINAPEVNYEFFKGIENNEAGTLVAITQSGQIKSSFDSGQTWETYQSSSNQSLSSISLNDIEYSNGIYVICGNSGRIFFSSDGTNWSSYQLWDAPNLYSAAIYNSKCYFTSDNGKIFVTEIQL